MERIRFQRLQALEDAIAYRRARVAAPCPDCLACAAGRRCDDHARDLELIAEYQQTVRLTPAEARPPVLPQCPGLCPGSCRIPGGVEPLGSP